MCEPPRNLQSHSMHPTHIAELLEPFLRSPTTANPYHSEPKTPSDPELKTSCHSESGQRPGEEPAVPYPANDDRLTGIDLERISTYIDILLRWNARINLTAIRDPEAIVTRHFGESLFAARYLFPKTAHVGTAAPGCPAEQCSAARALAKPHAETERALAPEGVPNDQRPTTSDVRVADLGSGAGFPGLPIKLWAP